MSRSCTVCGHSSASAIDALLQEDGSTRKVAATYGLSYAATLRHARNHVARGQPSAPQPTGDPSASAVDPLDELVAALRTRALTGDPSTAREYRLALATQTASKAVAPEYDVLGDVQWTTLRGLLLRALEPYAEARLAISEAIREYEEAR
jgi:hypothetical protein